MVLGLRIRQMLAAVVVAAAVLLAFAPGTAQAHAGHFEQQRAGAASVAKAAVPPAAHDAVALSAEAYRPDNALPARPAGSHGECRPGCCMGVSCCGSALLPHIAPLALPWDCGALIVTDMPPLRGIVPRSNDRPPRPFA